MSLRLHLGHTDEFLFLGFEVTDDFLDLDEGAAPFRNDSVEMFINADIAADDVNPDSGAGRNWGGEGFQIVADAAGEGDIEFNNRFSAGGNIIPVDTAPPGPEEFYTAGLPNDTGYVIEWQIPLASLDTDSNESVVPAKTGDVMLMNFAINDNDVEGANGQDTHAMLWVVEDDPRSPFGGGENVWIVPLQLSSETAGVPGDVDGDGDVDDADIDAVAAAVKNGQADAKFDINGDGSVSADDHKSLVKDILNTWIGDANLDKVFDTTDLITIFQAGKFEVDEMAGWSEGDFNGDMRFGTGDLIVSFQDGGFEKGPRAATAAAVPEPASLAMLLGLGGLMLTRRRRRG